MAHSIPVGFSLGDDAAFARLVDKHYISLTSPLLDVKPSDISLTSDYWATLDLNYLHGSTLQGYELDVILYIVNDFLTVLPEASADASALDIAQYWNVLSSL
ncbi:MAG: hypothetical protein M1828_002646 [Chrysothrix sp. TS-e1954]|nr:MAG: hypothetical protein M1828_002646 [Chrysothrix sp. TS-e1954]